ncbi:hypothetical protein DYB30_004758 [Aphanomyces astaci]|uniref:EGF-like domain-containing protein n=1 Tax=Aphanomyces astaci TaxID=112090 RepID=A0A397FGL0_APHAT|nr:hypothetical protein DYB34_004896 [Aphanomyces astaci]RHY64115.1 hypothetical protein DYB30_004758 [Aphanomyces astaci]RHZ30904.1 hypothetical protein DYB31_003066 [Aphanomyces astaci]
MFLVRWVVAGLAAASVTTADVCCGQCLNTFAQTIYDPSVWAECSTAPKPNPGCCFCDQVQTISQPAYKLTMKAGTTQFLTFPGAEKVTYSVVVDPTKAFQHPKPSGTQFTKNNAGNYVVCIDTPGKLLFRGWGKEVNNYPTECTQMTSELSITVTEGDKGATCAGSTPDQGGVSPSPTGADGKEVQCNLQRGSVIGGVCVCASDYSGAPECTGSSSWKWIVSICGGIAALLSIGISVRQILLFRKKKAEDKEREDAMTKMESVEVMNVSREPNYFDADQAGAKAPPPRRSPSRSPVPNNPRKPDALQPYPVARGGHANMSPRQSREYTL